MNSTPTQSQHPWRAVARTALAVISALAVAAPSIVDAITNGDASRLGATGAVVLAVSGGITRVLALPGVNDFLERFLPWLAAAPASEAQAVNDDLDAVAMAYEQLDDGPARDALAKVLGIED